MQPRKIEEVFELIERISKNDHVETWISRNRENGSSRVLKLSVVSKSAAPNTSKSFLEESYRCQRSFRSPRLLRALDLYVCSERIAVEYPYLEPNKWCRIEDERFLLSWKPILISMCETVDILHQAGHIHCDLKLENFFVESKDLGDSTILSDLDFLRPIGTRPDGFVFGTPEYFPPEMIASDPLTASSDNYSFGQSLARTINSQINTGRAAHGGSSLDLHSLKLFVNLLTRDDPCERPQTLGEALLFANVISESEFKSYLKKLFTHYLMISYSRFKRKFKKRDDRVKHSLGNANSIYGIPADLIDDLAEISKYSQLQTLTLVKTLVDKGNLTLDGNLWHVYISSEIICEIYYQIAHSSAADPLAVAKGKSRAELCSLSRDAQKLIVKRQYARALYLLKYHFKQSSLPSASTNHSIESTILIQLADCHIAVGEIARGIKLYKLCIDRMDERPYRAAQTTNKLVRICFAYGYLEGVENLIDNGLSLSSAAHSESLRQELLLKQVWREGEIGKMSIAESILEELTRNLSLEEQENLPAGILYASGTLEWRRGKYSQALEKITASLSARSDSALDESQLPAQMAIAHLYYEIGEYRKAVKHCLSVINLDELTASSRPLGMIILTLVNCYIRLEEFTKAKRSLSWFLPVMTSQEFTRALILHHATLGWLYLEEGQFQLSHEHLQLALSRAKTLKSGLVLGRIYQNLASLYLIRGRTSLCERSCISATTIFKAQKNQAALAEVFLIDYLNRLYSDSSVEINGLESILESLLNCHSTYYAALCGFHMLISPDVQVRNRATKQIITIKLFIDQSSCSLSRSLQTLVAVETQPPERRLQVGLLKKVYHELYLSNNKFLGSLVCSRISQIYQDDQNDYLACAYQGHAVKLLGEMSNEPLALILKSRSHVSDLQSEQFGRSEWLMSKLLKISEIIAKPDTYNETLKVVLTNLLEVTGAERGAIVIEGAPPNKPRVVSFVNCDAQSADEIREISLMIPLTALEKDEPFIVEDATTNEITKHYKSVLKYNVLSVICIPIRVDSGTRGILYLDHHTIPAFFQSFDVELAKMISNLVSITLATGESYRTLYQKHQQAEKDLAKLGSGPILLTNDRHMLSLLKNLETVAKSNATVLITGESGCGKEIIADLVHAHSHRREKPIIKINCAAIPENLVESELFGVAKNAVTGVDRREGLFSAADGGTLFIDEIGDLPFSVQAKLLRVIEDGRFRKIGSTFLESSDIRYVYATNKDLRKLIRNGNFREDLFYRLNTIEFKIPPLRDRLHDVELLINHFIKIFSPSPEGRPSMSREVLDILRSYDWPGNVRELKNIVERFCVLHAGRYVDKADLPQEFFESRGVIRSRNRRALPEAQELSNLLDAHGGNQSAVARVTGIPISTLNRRIKYLGLTAKK